MVSHRFQAHSFATLALILIGVFLLATPFVQGNETQSAGSIERLRELLVQRHTLLEQIVADLQKQVNLGMRDPSVLSAATVALYRAETELCTTDAERIAVCERMVKALSAHQNRITQHVEVGVMSNWQLNDAKAAVLQARIDLERLRLGQPSPH
jgi:hypothetical protein